MPDLMPLEEPFRTALDDAVAYIQGRYAPLGIVASGTIIRGAPLATSDLDLVVIHDAPWRQRTQRFFNGVPAEMFVNPAFQIRRQMLRDTEAGRPVMAHMLATGTIVLDPTGIAATLQAEARKHLATGPRIDQASLLQRKYAIATVLEDATDLRNTDPDRARSLAVESVVEAVKWWFLNSGRWLPRSKALITDLDALDPGLGESVRAALRSTEPDDQIDRAVRVVERLIGHTGFFEWESEPQQVDP